MTFDRKSDDILLSKEKIAFQKELERLVEQMLSSDGQELSLLPYSSVFGLRIHLPKRKTCTLVALQNSVPK